MSIGRRQSILHSLGRSTRSYQIILQTYGPVWSGQSPKLRSAGPNPKRHKEELMDSSALANTLFMAQHRADDINHSNTAVRSHAQFTAVSPLEQRKPLGPSPRAARCHSTSAPPWNQAPCPMAQRSSRRVPAILSSDSGEWRCPARKFCINALRPRRLIRRYRRSWHFRHIVTAGR